MKKSISLLEKYWIDEIGCQLSDLQAKRVKVCAHGKTLEGYSGIIFFRKSDACIASAPRSLVSEISEKISDKNPETVFNTDFLADLLGNRVDHIIGPAWVGQIDDGHFRPCHASESRELTEADHEVFSTFIRSCTETEVAHSSLEWGHRPMIGAFDGKKLAAVAGYEVLENILAHIGVLADPRFRGKGYARKALSHITAMALHTDLGVQYQTLVSNLSSVALARKIGFTQFAQTIAVRLNS